VIYSELVIFVAVDILLLLVMQRLEGEVEHIDALILNQEEMIPM
jgi:hypothetical protein